MSHQVYCTVRHYITVSQGLYIFSADFRSDLTIVTIALRAARTAEAPKSVYDDVSRGKSTLFALRPLTHSFTTSFRVSNLEVWSLMSICNWIELRSCCTCLWIGYICASVICKLSVCLPWLRVCRDYIERDQPFPWQDQIDSLFVSVEYFAALLPDIWSKLDKADADYFREDREKMFGGKLEEVSKGSNVSLLQFHSWLCRSKDLP